MSKQSGSGIKASSLKEICLVLMQIQKAEERWLRTRRLFVYGQRATVYHNLILVTQLSSIRVPHLFKIGVQMHCLLLEWKIQN